MFKSQSISRAKYNLPKQANRLLVAEKLLPDYTIRSGSTLDRALLVKFMQRTYQDMFPKQDFSHLSQTVEQYLSPDTPVWWVEYSPEK